MSADIAAEEPESYTGFGMQEDKPWVDEPWVDKPWVDKPWVDMQVDKPWVDYNRGEHTVVPPSFEYYQKWWPEQWETFFLNMAPTGKQNDGIQWTKLEWVDWYFSCRCHQTMLAARHMNKDHKTGLQDVSQMAAAVVSISYQAQDAAPKKRRAGPYDYRA
jgi:hypothetical protein